MPLPATTIQADDPARIIRLVSTTSRTASFLSPLLANYVNLGLDFVIRQFGLRDALPVRFGENSVEAFRQQTIEQSPPLVG
jgi:hypothetical protein